MRRGMGVDGAFSFSFWACGGSCCCGRVGVDFGGRRHESTDEIPTSNRWMLKINAEGSSIELSVSKC